jgi:D-glutamate cyclase
MEVVVEESLDFELARAVGEVVDRLVTVQVANSGGGSVHLQAPINAQIYQAARDAQGEPLTYKAARVLLESIRPGDSVVLTSGFFVPPFMEVEVDGNFGVAALARSLVISRSARPIILTEDNNLRAMNLLCRAVGLVPYQSGSTLPRGIQEVRLDVLPRSEPEARHLAERLIEQDRPAAFVAAEKPARNAKGVYHNGGGIDLSRVQGKADDVVEVFRSHGIPTIGVGDGGNEIGMGKIAGPLRDILPAARDCGCPCGAGIASATDTDVLVVGSSANWGCYGIEAVMAAALGDLAVLHAPEVERRIYIASVFGGLVDPSTGLADGWTDGAEHASAEALLVLLKQSVESRLRKKQQGPQGWWNRARHYERSVVEGWVRDWADQAGVPQR